MPNKKEERHERILTEATRLFAEKGYEQTSVSDIVKACDMARGTFYLYFENLEQVLAELFSRTMNVLWDEAERTGVAHQWGEDAIRWIVPALFRLLAERKELLSVFHCGGGRTFNEFKYRTIRDTISVRVSRILEQVQESPDARRCSPELGAMMIVTLVDQMAYYTIALEEGGYANETVVQELIDFILYGLSARPQA